MHQTHQELIEHCRALTAATEDMKWGNNLVFSVGDKMFAAYDMPDGVPFSFKTDPLVFDSLVTHQDIVPAPYLARHHWVSVRRADALPIDDLQALLADAHQIVAAKLSKTKQRKLGLIDA